MQHHRVDILGTLVSSLTMDELFSDWEAVIQKGEKAQVCITPVNSILAARATARVQEIYKHADYVLCDGVPVKWASNFLGDPIKERITGLDVLPRIFPFAASKNFSIFLLGASPGVAETLKTVMEAKHPGVKVVGTFVPPFRAVFSDEENEEMIKAINAVKPDILLVSLTAPKQDIWIAENLEKLDTRLAIGIGGAFEVAAGMIQRAPLWMQKSGLEWFYRFLQEPKRMFRRYFVEAPVFIPLIIQQKISTRFGRP
ncbi:WecB/TagA/CpsF family glycosyltransferase [Aquirufa antheringensis]|uniref:WecB/TagA/CpsF family glycosyltransferase n=1 Tax=Aquirufa antheringensis TaxID=2516559 RepID=UPI00208DF30B|nr:WecB/TagA/CpsF family glycosyltransferase [Aquirufa antheringensis]USQ03318.1 WecB/TagA/CpsF family glycosyltransferase [Aquirufa antheringensis]